jgi:(+)-pinoresinol hydroxylase
MNWQRLNWQRLNWIACSIYLVACGAQAAAPSKSGQQLYQYWCATCHGRGANMPGTAALAAKYDGTVPAALEDRTNLNRGIVRYFARNGISVMPFFRKTEISDAELTRIADYLAREEKR